MSLCVIPSIVLVNLKIDLEMPSLWSGNRLAKILFWAFLPVGGPPVGQAEDEGLGGAAKKQLTLLRKA